MRYNEGQYRRPCALKDEVIAAYLDDKWRTPMDVHRLLSNRGEPDKLAHVLERLFREGKIECKHEATMAPRYHERRGAPVLCINYYRRLEC